MSQHLAQHFFHFIIKKSLNFHYCSGCCHRRCNNILEEDQKKKPVTSSPKPSKSKPILFPL